MNSIIFFLLVVRRGIEKEGILFIWAKYIKHKAMKLKRLGTDFTVPFINQLKIFLHNKGDYYVKKTYSSVL